MGMCKYQNLAGGWNVPWLADAQLTRSRLPFNPCKRTLLDIPLYPRIPATPQKQQEQRTQRVGNASQAASHSPRP